ncbi:hypothetical protein GCM10007079_32690 [Nocardiopsis terrae]|nr:hypothetical protein GCM10007079_32690 [Nocardiopsis terrae]
MGINRSTLQSWMRDRSLVDKYLGTDLCPRCEPIPGTPKPLDAYSYLLGLYFGDGSLTPAGDPAKRVWRLRVMCSDTWPGLIELCAGAMAAIRPDHKVSRVPSTGCTEVHSNWKHWPCLFPQHGPGRKHDRTIALEPWQQVIVEEHPKNFVRGLIHSDGSRVLNRVKRKHPDGCERYYEYPRYHFTNVSTDVIGLCTEALDQLDIPWKVHTSKGKGTHQDKHVVSISRKEAVARMDSFVGPKY